MSVSSATFLWRSYPEIVDWMANGGSVDVTGNYTVWLKARQGSGCQLTIGESVLPPTHIEGDARYYSWAKVGTVSLKAEEKFDVQVEILQPASGTSSGQEIAAMALTRDEKADPKVIDEVSLVFSKTMEPPKDRRLWDVRNLNRYYSWPGYETKEAWDKRAKDLREHCAISCGLWPEPKRCPLNSQIFDRIERDGYSVEKVYFESWPGFFVTGNLYRPLGKKGPFPAIASPHGHWETGRLANDERGSVPGRCINFARQGYVIFSYDMLHYCDSKQLHPHGLWDPHGHLWGVSPMGIQTWNSVRVIDFLESLEDVDRGRIGCTGASGGGTQTFLLTAIDDRLKVVAPVNMISAHMQGGCDCENAPNLRVDAYNVEIGALAAPKPLIMVCCTGDWTDETPWNEYPATQSIYRLFGAEDRVTSTQVDAGHNYNKESREAVYAWFGKWFLGIDDPAKLRERPFTVEKDEDLLVFARRELPDTGINWETLTGFIIKEAKQQLGEIQPRNREDLQRFRKTMEPALRHAIGAEKPSPCDVIVERVGRSKKGEYAIHQMILGRRGQGDQIPAICYAPIDLTKKHPATILVHPEGKSFFANTGEGTPGDMVSKLLGKGHIVLAIDPFLCGEYDTPWQKSSRDKSDKFFTVYNHTDHSCRIQDILTAISCLESWDFVESVNVVGVGEAGIWCLLARGLAPDVRSLAVEIGEKDFREDETWMDDLYIPLIRRVGDLETAMTLTAPGRLLLYNTGTGINTATIRSLYRDLGSENNLRIDRGSLPTGDLVSWLEAQ
ncbi:MAG: acetylxylan esterase [bacterium]